MIFTSISSASSFNLSYAPIFAFIDSILISFGTSQTYSVINCSILVIGINETAFLNKEKYLSFKLPNFSFNMFWYCMFVSQNIKSFFL